MPALKDLRAQYECVGFTRQMTMVIQCIRSAHIAKCTLAGRVRVTHTQILNAAWRYPRCGHCEGSSLKIAGCIIVHRRERYLRTIYEACLVDALESTDLRSYVIPVVTRRARHSASGDGHAGSTIREVVDAKITGIARLHDNSLAVVANCQLSRDI